MISGEEEGKEKKKGEWWEKVEDGGWRMERWREREREREREGWRRESEEKRGESRKKGRKKC